MKTRIMFFLICIIMAGCGTVGQRPREWVETAPRSEAAAVKGVAPLELPKEEMAPLFQARFMKAEADKDDVGLSLALLGLRLIRPEEAEQRAAQTLSLDDVGSRLTLRRQDARWQEQRAAANDEEARRTVEKIEKERQPMIRSLEDRRRDVESLVVRLTLADEELSRLVAQKERTGTPADEREWERARDKKGQLAREKKEAEDVLALLQGRVDKLDDGYERKLQTQFEKEEQLRKAELYVRQTEGDLQLFRWVLMESEPAPSTAARGAAEPAPAVKAIETAPSPNEEMAQGALEPISPLPPEPEPVPVQASAPAPAAFAEPETEPIPIIEVPYVPEERAPSPPSLVPPPPVMSVKRAEPVPPSTNARTYRVERGDTLPNVARKVYGDASRWEVLYNVNQYAITRGLLEPGQWLLIP
jgi:hypothetical protein